MAFEKLDFTKNWTSPIDFSTYEASEAQVRADMQFLHDEARVAINRIVDILNSAGAENISTETGDTIAKVLADLNAKIDNVAGGTAPGEGVASEWDLDMGSHRILNIGPPEEDGDAVNKGWVNANAITAEAVRNICV